MMHRAFNPIEKLERCSNARIFGESFQLEDSLAKQLDGGWHLDGYVDRDQIEHIRIYRTTEEEDAQHWEILRFDEDEAPLELFLLQDDIDM